MSSCTEISLDPNFTSEFLAPGGVPPPASNEDTKTHIAPWEEPPTPPPKSSQRSFGIASKASFSSFALRQSSSSTLIPYTHRGSESHSIAESLTNSSIYTNATLMASQQDLPKAKSPISIFSRLKSPRSRARLRTDSELDNDKRDKISGKRKSATRPPPLPPKQPHEPEIVLDSNIDDMTGIVDLTALPLNSVDGSNSSPGSGFDGYLSSGLSHSDASLRVLPPSPASSIFTNANPFQPSSSVVKRKHHILIDHRKVSPKSQPPAPALHVQPAFEATTPSTACIDGEIYEWKPPQSWGFVKDGEDDQGEAAYYSSSDGGEGVEGGRGVAVATTVAISNGGAAVNKHKSRRKVGGTVKLPKPPSGSKGTFAIRIYRANNTYHVAAIASSTTVAELIPVLNQKLLLDAERETHRLYLKERGRERVLAQTERPADIVQRRLEQAGYDIADGLHKLGAEDMSFLMKFVYKSQLLGPAEGDLNFDSFEYVDLTGRSLRTIPVVLHTQADAIVTLTLSRNPMVEIPLDFIQSCTTLRELRLSNMAMKKVPQSVRHSTTLNRLDISSNRIADLNDAGLDCIPELTTLKVENNRMEKLPWYFPRLRALKYLTISNNKFRYLPAVVCEMTNLVDLDISFNMISELPEEIGQLTSLQRLIFVGNQITKFPDECRNLVSLEVLDCRRNSISDLAVVCMLPKLVTLNADHNAVHALDLSLGPNTKLLDASHNDITQLSLAPGPIGQNPYALTSLDVSHARLSSLDDFALAQLSSLETLKLDHNLFRFIPESLGELSRLTWLSCSDNSLDALPSSIGRLQRLEHLDVHNNSLTELPVSLWNCASLTVINVTSNLLGVWHDPPTMAPFPALTTASSSDSSSSSWTVQGTPERKTSASGSITSHSGRPLPPLAHSLEKLYLGENRLTDDVLHPLTILKELRVLNLSFNDIQEMPPSFFRNLTTLQELYLSGNKLSSIPTEDLHRLKQLTILFLNGNKLQTLPQELGKVKSLTVLDVGSNILKYNVNNWKFDWNWNFNQNLKYLNLSGNKRLEIMPETNSQKAQSETKEETILAGFSGLPQLRVLGLMDVTTTFVSDIPDENEDRRVRTSLSEVNKMAYGIADNLGKTEKLSMLDLVQPNFRDKREEAVFAMFGRAHQSNGDNKLSKILRDKFLPNFVDQLDHLDSKRNEGITDALRRSFLRLNKVLHDELYTMSSNSRKMSQASASSAGTTFINPTNRSGASGIVLYFVAKTLYVANAGNALAVISRQGTAEVISTKHDPFDRSEITRIRGAEGWVSPKGFVNDEVDISRSFGFYHLMPVVNARPDIRVYELSELDEFVIIGNRGLWDFVSYQTAVDIARSERADPMIAAQKLRDFAISYGADGSTMIMVIAVADLFTDGPSRRPTMDSFVDPDPYSSINKRRKRDDIITDRNISRLDGEVPPPTGHLALVFTDIRNSTHLWEANAGMPTAMRLHNNLLRRQLRFCGGYEVKTEGDAFMCSFPTALSALWFCLTVQIQLLNERWPLEILECEDGKEIVDAKGKLIARGLSVRMGIHCGMPVCEPDPITHRMDYFGPMVNRSARINGSAGGGQIMCSADIVREINAKILDIEPDTEFSDFQPPQAVDAIRRMRPVVIPVGEVKLKGLEIPEVLSLVYPHDLVGRQELETYATDPNSSGSRVQYSIAQMHELGVLCLRLEALASGRIFRPPPERKGSLPDIDSDELLENEPSDSFYFYSDPKLLLPTISEKASDVELTFILDSLSVRISNAVAKINADRLPATSGTLSILRQLDEGTLQKLLAMLETS